VSPQWRRKAPGRFSAWWQRWVALPLALRRLERQKAAAWRDYEHLYDVDFTKALQASKRHEDLCVAASMVARKLDALRNRA
jgi:hypothetical protein